MHKFTYSKSKTKEDVFRCLIESFKYYGGVPKRLLTDNMSSIVNVKTKSLLRSLDSFQKILNLHQKNAMFDLLKLKEK